MKSNDGELQAMATNDDKAPEVKTRLQRHAFGVSFINDHRRGVSQILSRRLQKKKKKKKLATVD